MTHLDWYIGTAMDIELVEDDECKVISDHVLDSEMKPYKT